MACSNDRCLHAYCWQTVKTRLTIVNIPNNMVAISNDKFSEQFSIFVWYPLKSIKQSQPQIVQMSMIISITVLSDATDIVHDCVCLCVAERVNSKEQVTRNVNCVVKLECLALILKYFLVYLNLAVICIIWPAALYSIILMVRAVSFVNWMSECFFSLVRVKQMSVYIEKEERRRRKERKEEKKMIERRRNELRRAHCEQRANIHWNLTEFSLRKLLPTRKKKRTPMILMMHLYSDQISAKCALFNWILPFSWHLFVCVCVYFQLWEPHMEQQNQARVLPPCQWCDPN